METQKAQSELESFHKIWSGGYYEGDPLDPLSRSKYGRMGYMSILHAVYLCCIKPYLDRGTVALEIGPGRGAWTKALLPAREVWALDALSAQHNGFFEYVGQQPQVRYFQVNDFSCSMLPENHFDYVFSFGCLCHVSFDGIMAYARNLYPKLKSGANCFWLVADYDKYNRTLTEFDRYDIVCNMLPPGRIRTVIKWPVDRVRPNLMQLKDKSEDDNPRPARWYHAGTEQRAGCWRKLVTR